MASMFHKPLKKELSAVLERKSRPRPKPRPVKRDPEPEEVKPPPTGTYTDFQVVSTSLRNWKYDIMKFDSRGKEVDPTKWNTPVKLNRKDYRPPENGAQDAPVPVELKPMLGPDGKPVVGVDGKVVMVGPDGKVPQANGTASKAAFKDTKAKGKGRVPFKTKTKQVFLVPEETRKLRREERYPWVMEEDGQDGQVWVGHLENPEKALTHALLVPSGNQFKFVPAHRWYKFQKRPKHRILGLEEAEAEYAKLQKNKDPERWLMRKKAAGGKGPSEATLATLKSEANGSGSGSSIEANGLKMVDSGGADLFGDEDDEEEKINRKRRDREMGGEGDLDEMEYEEDFADDEEKVEQDGDDEEAKEIEERLKREYRNANKLRDAHVDEDEEEEEEQLTGAGRDLKKLVRKTDKNEAYDSDDDDKDPYASEEDEPEEPPPSQTVLNEPAVINQSQSQPASGTTTPPRPSGSQQQPRPQKVKNKNLQQPHANGRANSPGLGNAMVAKRATSPKAPKQKVIASGSRAGSPLASGSRAVSPVPPTTTGSRPASPGAGGSRAGSPTTGKSLKRKATDDAPTSGLTPTSSAISAPDGPKPKKKIKRAEGPLEESMVIAFLREKKDATTKDCIVKFQPYVKDEETKKAFTAMVKKVAIFKKNALQLRPEYQ